VAVQLHTAYGSDLPSSEGQEEPRLSTGASSVFLPFAGQIGSAPGRIRTSDSRFRKPLLYPLSYRRADVLSLAQDLGVYQAPALVDEAFDGSQPVASDREAKRS
jgi:hypothetical protein